MFALINEMEMAIKINTLIIFRNRAHPMWVKLNAQVWVCVPKSGQPGEEILHEQERVLRALPFVVGCVKRLFLVYFKPAAF